MAIIVRRVFFAKVGKAGPLVSLLKEMNVQIDEAGIKSRVLTDYESGRSDRVVVEWEVESFGALESTFQKIMTDPSSQATFEAWETRMNDLIHYSEAEMWSIR